MFQRPPFIALLLMIAAAVPAGQQQPTFRTRVDAVTVDVIATDSQGHPVTDLTVADYAIVDLVTPRDDVID